jgi:two-component system sensor histidine kinase BaeS
MRTRLFLAFFAVILTALISNLIFERLILRDFEEYVLSQREDRLYWVLASTEGSFGDGAWDVDALRRNMHWAMMLGFDIEVRDASDKAVLTSRDVVKSLSEAMRRRMEAIVELDTPRGEFESYPLFMGGEEIGTLRVRGLKPVSLLSEKEEVFERRGRNFLMMSFLIAGGGAVFLSVVFSMFLSDPVRRLKKAAEQVAEGDLRVRVGTGSDDEIGRLNRSFNHMVESLEREETLRKHLTSNIAHELRTPLAIMKGNFEAISDGVKEPDAETLDALSSEVERLITLVEGIEDITKAEASFFEKAEYHGVDVGELISSLLQGIHPLFEEKGLSVEVVNERPFAVKTDPEKLEIILRNIINNALRHTEKGRVTVDYGIAGPGTENFFVSVQDTGGGIEEKDLELVFRRFHKGEESTGIGLGLAIARELAEVMGGTVTVESVTGRGSTFTVILPCH